MHLYVYVEPLSHTHTLKKVEFDRPGHTLVIQYSKTEAC